MLPKPNHFQGVKLADYISQHDIYKMLGLELIKIDTSQVPNMLVSEIIHFEQGISTESGNDQTMNFKCRLCDKTFKNSQGLNKHIGKVHNSAKCFPCSECNKTFKHRYAVKFHVQQVHHKTTRVICESCDKDFYNKYQLKKHYEKFHLDDNTRTPD